MSIQVHTTDWLRQLLCSAGFHRRPAGRRSSPLGLDLLARDDGTTAAIVHPPRLTPPSVGGAPLQDQFDTYLQRLLRRLRALAAHDIHVQHLFFTGNGPIMIPRWFRDACAELGTHIHTVDPALPPDSLRPFF
jgi:hypothetical protein